MNRTILILLFQLIWMPCIAQTQFGKLKAQAESWLSKELTADPMPKGADSKTIDYPQGHYCITGYFLKGKLAEGQIVEVFDTEANPKTILKGKVSYVADRPRISGIKYDYSEHGPCYTYGSFFISNTPDNVLSYKPKKSLDLTISDSETVYYMGYYLECPTIVSVINPFIAVDGKTGGRGYTEFSAPLESSVLSRIGFSNIFDLLMSTSKGATMTWENGFYKEFKGTVFPQKSAEGSILFLHLVGERTGFQSGAKTMRVFEEGKSLCMELNDNPDNKLLKSETIVVPDKTLIAQNSYWDLRSFLENMIEVRWMYRNGNSFVGQATFTETKSEDGQSSSFSESIETGTYKYSNGDYFIGNVGGASWGALFFDGTTYFKDRTKKEGYWIEQYSLSDAQWDELANVLTPSDFRDKAEQYSTINKIRRSVYGDNDLSPAEHILSYLDCRNAFARGVDKRYLTDPLPNASTKEVVEEYKEYLVKVRYFMYLRGLVEQYLMTDHGAFSSKNISDALTWESGITVPSASFCSDKYFDVLLATEKVVKQMSPQTVRNGLITRYNDEPVGLNSPKRRATDHKEDLDSIIAFLTPYINIYSELAAIEYNDHQKEIICSGYYRYWHQKEMKLRDEVTNDVSAFLAPKGKKVTHISMDGGHLYFTNGDVAYVAIPITKSSAAIYYFPKGLKKLEDYYPLVSTSSYEHYMYDTQWYKVDEVLNAETTSATIIQYYRNGKKSYVKQYSGKTYNEKWYDTDGVLIRSNP